ncbi:hypothetical protein EBU24_00315 [bacterium]|nr:hypothetical protein [bacterium]
MKIIIKNVSGEFFSRKPEVGLTKLKKDAYVFDCYNEEHANLVLEKTKQFISNDNLCLEIIEKTQVNLNLE